MAGVNNNGVEGPRSPALTVVYDTTAPAITTTVSPSAPNSADWYNTPVTVTFGCSDALSGVASCSGPTTVGNDGANQTVTGTATDNADNSATTSATISLDQTAPVVRTPVWDANPITAGQTADLSVPVSDNLSGVIGGEYYIGSADPGAGNGTPMAYDGTSLTTALGADLAPGTYLVNIRAEDAAGNWSGTTTASLTVNPAGTAPAFTSATAANAGTNAPFTFTVTTTGSPAPALSYTGSLPAGLTFTDNGDGTATISGNVTGTPGQYPLAFTAANAAGSATQDFTLSVNPVSITSPAADTESYGSPFTFTITTTGSPAPAITKTGGLPPGVTFADNGDGTATIGGTPTGSASGPYSLAIKAKNSQGSASQTFVLSITKAPVIKTVPTKTAHVGTNFSLNVAATGYNTPALQAGTLPPGLRFTGNGNGTGTISGTPPTGSGSQYFITLTATNSYGTATETFILKVDEGPAITSANAATATTGQAFSFQVTATGYPAPSISKTGTLPAGISYHAATRTFSGTPKPGTAGTYPITITAKNSTGTITHSFVLTVNQESGPA